jgi:acyl dehydratase
VPSPPPERGPRFSDVQVGDTLGELRQEVTQESIDRFATVSLDFNPVHIDPEWSARARVFGFGETVLHGMASMSLMTSVVIRAWGALAAIRSIDSKFTKPTPVGQTLTVSGVVVETHFIGPGRNYVVVDITAVDGDGDTVGISRVDVALPD